MKIILTSVWGVQHQKAGQNIQQGAPLNCIVLYHIFIMPPPQKKKKILFLIISVIQNFFAEFVFSIIKCNDVLSSPVIVMGPSILTRSWKNIIRAVNITTRGINSCGTLWGRNARAGKDRQWAVPQVLIKMGSPGGKSKKKLEENFIQPAN